MAYRINDRGKSRIKNYVLFLLLTAVASLIAVNAQSPAPSPTPSGEPVTFMGYDVTSSFELGVRGASINGNVNKFRSDFNYHPGFRMFDSSLLLENKEKKSKFVDSFLITSTGWNADPSGFTRVMVDKAGLYKFDSKVRRITYFNYLNNSERGGRNFNTKQNLGDFDLTLYPMAEKLTVRIGGSFNTTSGVGTYLTRPYSDQYIIDSHVKGSAYDLRAGVDGKLLGFDLSVAYGVRRFRDNTFYTSGFNPGFNTTNNGLITSLLREYPIKGLTNYGLFSAHRTFAKKLDFTARVIYSSTTRTFGYNEVITGRDNSNNFVDLDNYTISGNSKRPQTRADLGLTYMINDKFRISDSFSFDQFNISGVTNYTEAVFSRTSAGVARPTTLTNNWYDRVTGFRRYTNTLGFDVQVNNKFAFNLGYRYGNRHTVADGFNQPLPPATNLTRTIITEEETNKTNTFIGGFKIKPTKYWVVFGDVEHGTADNAFSRLENYKVTNFRIRSRWTLNRFSFNISGITKDNNNPSSTVPNPPANYPTGDFIANTKTRTFSAYIDWTPEPRFSFSGGYTYTRSTSETDIVINTGTLVRGISRFYMRDNYAFFNFSAQPSKRILFYASYNYNKDNGQGNLTAALPILISSYPFKLMTGEGRLAFRITRNIEWNLGYQYIGYHETVQPLSVTGYGQDYHANLPYTSLRFYFGGGDR
ncbi:MAG: hypothetical protein JSS81_17070 [Acidobacteria bacterium]|nr:hypothetical protein [Acidobacteriota bacterium]